MGDETTDINNLNWQNFKNRNYHKGNLFFDIIEAIDKVEEKKTSISVENALSNLRSSKLKMSQEENDVIFKKLQKELRDMEKSHLKELNWWDKFTIRKGNNETVKEIIELIEIADKSEKEKDIDKADKAIEKLDPNKFEYDKRMLVKKLKILKNRNERKISKNFGSILSSLRAKQGLSLAKLGDMTGVSASYINRMELNQRKAPSYPIIEKLADALDVDINMLLIAAGANLEKSETKSMRELFFSNNISIEEDSEALTPDQKEKLIKIIDFIFEIEWKENKHVESLELFSLISDLKSTK